MKSSQAFAVIFIATAFLAAWWMMTHIPHHVVLHINNHWHVMLIGEKKTSAVSFNSFEFETVREDTASLWISGSGQIRWHDHTITVANTDISLDTHKISKSTEAADANLMFYPDGRVSKGQLQLH